MRVLVADATGVMGRALIPLLKQAGHSVITITRSRAACEKLRDQGVTSFVCDLYDEERLREVFWESSPHAVINSLTSKPANMRPQRVAHDTAANKRLRTEGTRMLLDAARLFRVRQFITQSMSFVHRADVAAATLAALESGAQGTYNIVDDERAADYEWLPCYVRTLDAPSPRSRRDRAADSNARE